MWWNDEIPENIRTAARQAGVSLDGDAVHLASDLNPQGAFDSRWLVMSRKHLLVLTTDGAVERRLALADVDALEAQNHVGGGLLAARLDGEVVPLVRYSAARGLAFGMVARGFARWKGGGSIEGDSGKRPNRCPHCGHVLGPHESVCPRCNRKWEIVRRIWQYTGGYR